jgi:hypothetical protein
MKTTAKITAASVAITGASVKYLKKDCTIKPPILNLMRWSNFLKPK